MNDLPIIQCKATPTDAELQADRDAKHAVAVAEWMRQDDTAAAIAMAHNQGWFEAFAKVQGLLKERLDSVNHRYAAAVEKGDDRLRLINFGHKIALMGLMEELLRTAGR